MVRGGVATFGAFQGDEEGARQAEREEVARRSARASGTRPSPCRGRRRQRRGQWAGLALAAAGLHREEAQVSIPFYFCSLFYFSDICFDLVIILNQFISLCPFL